LTVQMLFYEQAVPLSAGRHADCAVEVRDYTFCRRVNSVPLTAVEFRSAAGEYPIVFVADGQSVQPAVVLGLRAQENLYVSDDGEWQGRYVPAFVRRYPFVFSQGTEDRHFVLCVDEAFHGFNRAGRGNALFTPDGQPSTYVERVLRFLQDYRAQFVRTRAFCARLAQLELFVPMRARVGAAGAEVSLGGFSIVDRNRLKALSGERLTELMAEDELELVYLHLQSLRNFEAMRHRLPAAAVARIAEPELPGALPGAPFRIH
jgi:hypothetical protein